MIIKGKAVTGPQALARYLQSKEVNERAEVIEVRGTAATDPEGALIEMDAYAEGTRCQKPLYHVKINPQPPYRLSREQLNVALDLIEQKFDMVGHARVVVIHEKLGREHIHVIWSRIDLENMRAVPLSHNYRLHEEIARELERLFGHERVQGAHAEREDDPRPDRTLSAAEMRQEERTGISAKNVKEQVTAAFRSSDNAEAFCAALEDAGYVLAKGDRRDFLIVDRAGGPHSLGRRIEGVKAAELRAFMASVDRDALPNLQQAKEIVAERDRDGYYAALDERKWEDALAASAISQAQREDREQKELQENEWNRKLDSFTVRDELKWEDALGASAIDRAKKDDAELRNKRRASHNEALQQKEYSVGDDYVHQTDAALKDFERRAKAINKERASPYHPNEHLSRNIKNASRRVAANSTKPHKRPEAQAAPEISFGPVSPEPHARKVADRLHDRVEQFLYGERGHKGSEQRREAENSSGRSKAERQKTQGQEFMKDKRVNEKTTRFDHIEKSEKLYERIQRMHDRPDFSDIEHIDPLEPDRQRSASGGGRTRSR